MLFTLLVAAAAATAATVARAQEDVVLQLGYPTKINVGPSGCVAYVDVPVGSRQLRIFADKGWGSSLVWLGGSETTLSAGPVGIPIVRDGGEVIRGSKTGDMSVVVDTTNKPGRWWIRVESAEADDVWLSAVAYDFLRKPRVTAQLGKRTGIIAVEYGAAEIYRVQLPASTEATTLKVNINAGWIGTVGEAYDVYANVIDDERINMLIKGVNIFSLKGFLEKITAALKSGELSELVPDVVTPGPDSFDQQAEANLLNLGKVDINVGPSSQPSLVYVAIVPKGGTAWSGDQTSFTVSFATAATPEDSKLSSTGTCAAPPQ